MANRPAPNLDAGALPHRHDPCREAASCNGRVVAVSGSQARLKRPSSVSPMYAQSYARRPLIACFGCCPGPLPWNLEFASRPALDRHGDGQGARLGLWQEDIASNLASEAALRQ